MDANKDEIIKNALAEYFECDPDVVSVFVVCCERREGNTTTFSSAWSGLPIYYVLGLIEELKRTVEQQRTKLAMEQLLSEIPENNG